MSRRPVAYGEIVQLHGREIGIRHGDEGPLQRADPRGAQTDLLHGADLVAVLAEIADSNGPVGEQADPPDQVLERLLGGQRDGDAADAEAGQGGRDVHTQASENRENADQEDHDLGEAGRRRQDRQETQIAAALRAGAQCQGAEVDQPEGDPRDGHDEQEDLQVAERTGKGNGEPQGATSHGEEDHRPHQPHRPLHELDDAGVEAFVSSREEDPEKSGGGSCDQQ